MNERATSPRPWQASSCRRPRDAARRRRQDAAAARRQADAGACPRAPRAAGRAACDQRQRRPGAVRGFGLPVLADDGPAGQAGPLAGILSGLDWAKARDRLQQAADGRRRHAVLSGRSGARLNRRDRRIPRPHRGRGIRRPAPSGLRALAGARWQPTSAFPGRKRDFQRRGLSRCGTTWRQSIFRSASAGGESLDPFFNMNTPQDLAEAERCCRETPT